MLDKKYQKRITEIIKKHLGKNVKAFVFGSSVKKENFNDIDVAIMGENIDLKKISSIINELEESLIPYKVDIIDLNKTDEKFKNKILKGKIIWLI